jgi:hypothetical protein
MVIRFEPISAEPEPPERKKPAVAAKIESSSQIETPQTALPFPKPLPRGGAKARRTKP